MIGIVVSRADEVSMQLCDQLLDLAEWTEREDADRPDAEGGGSYHVTEGFELRTFDELHLQLEGVAEAFSDPELLVFPSRHSGETGALLTAHVTGNFGAAEFGGEDGALAPDCPNAKDSVLRSLAEHAPDRYDVGVECTHHGPSDPGAPAIFVEHGSGEQQWGDEDASRAVARSILDLAGVSPHRERQLVGIGGGHYAPRFTRIARETEWAVGHIAADWSLDALDDRFDDERERRAVLRRAFERSDAEYAVIDGERPEIAATISELGYRVVSETWLREVDRVPLALVERIERELGSVDEGVRFGAPADGYDGAVEIVELPRELLDEATGIDQTRTLDAVDRHTIAYETAESGTLVGDRAAVADEREIDELVDSLGALLAEQYETVERTDDAVLATETVFVPERAATLGVPEGPSFGKLAAGESVTVNDEEIDPDAVTETRTREFPVYKYCIENRSEDTQN